MKSSIEKNIIQFWFDIQTNKYKKGLILYLCIVFRHTNMGGNFFYFYEHWKIQCSTNIHNKVMVMKRTDNIDKHTFLFRIPRPSKLFNGYNLFIHP